MVAFTISTKTTALLRICVTRFSICTPMHPYKAGRQVFGALKNVDNNMAFVNIAKALTSSAKLVLHGYISMVGGD